MKIFISDLHLLSEEWVRQGYRSITEEDVQSLWDDIKDKVVTVNENGKPIKKKVEDAKCSIELVILGDFIDVIRDPTWLWSLKRKVLQKSLKEEFKNDDWKEVVKEIVDLNLKVHEKFFNKLRALFGDSAANRNITYIMGNHDRLINFVPEACRNIRKSLGHDPKDVSPFEGEKSWPELGIYAEHGHKGDTDNYITGCEIDHTKIPLGDRIVLLLINGFPIQVSKPDIMVTIKSKGYRMLPDYLGEFMAELDNLRPTTLAPEWMGYARQRFRSERYKEIETAWKKQHKELKENVPWWKFSERGKVDALRIVTTKPKLAKIAKKIYKFTDSTFSRTLKLSQEKDYRFFICGHTHEPCIKLLDERKYRRRYYLNTGTWRHRIIMSSAPNVEISFAPIRTFNYLLFYEENERPMDASEMDKRFELCDISSELGEFI